SCTRRVGSRSAARPAGLSRTGRRVLADDIRVGRTEPAASPNRGGARLARAVELIAGGAPGPTSPIGEAAGDPTLLTSPRRDGKCAATCVRRRCDEARFG